MMSAGQTELLLGLSVSRETMERLRGFLALVEKWNSAINLISRNSVSDAWARHLLDSARIFPFAPEDAKVWTDLGSGGGFPGIVVAVLAKELRPDLQIRLVESDLRKATFLREATRTFDLNATVIAGRIDEVAPLNSDVLSARALAPLEKLLPFALRHMKRDGCALFLKGKTHPQEIDEARLSFRFQVEKMTSDVEDGSAILRIQGIEKVEK